MNMMIISMNHFSFSVTNRQESIAYLYKIENMANPGLR